MSKNPLVSSPGQRWAEILAHFFVGQISIQLLNFLTGFLLLRWLSVTAYAQFSVAFAFQSMLGALIDLGFSNSIVALTGDRAHEGAVIGSYIRSAQHYRARLFFWMVGGSLIAFPLVTSRQHWPLVTQLLLFVSVISTVFFQGWSMYAAPLLIHRRLKPYYRAQVISAAGRLLLCFLLHLGSVLTAWTTSWIAAAVFAVNGSLYRKEAKTFITEPTQSDTLSNRQMMKYLSPLIPGVVFTAFQGQISIALITLFGQTRNIAEVAALGRLAQIFLILGAFNSVVIEPYIAQVSAIQFPKRYWQIVLGASLFAAVISTLAFRFSQPLLWLIGPKYHQLGGAIGWVMLTSCISYVSGVLWTIHSARKWVWWWGTFAYIGILLLSQAIAVATLDLSKTIGVVFYGLVVSIAIFLTHALSGIYGFYTLRQDRQRLREEANAVGVTQYTQSR